MIAAMGDRGGDDHEAPRPGLPERRRRDPRGDGGRRDQRARGPVTETLRDGFHIRRAAAEKRIPCLTSLDTATAAVQALMSGEQQFTIQPLRDYLAASPMPRWIPFTAGVASIVLAIAVDLVISFTAALIVFIAAPMLITALVYVAVSARTENRK